MLIVSEVMVLIGNQCLRKDSVQNTVTRIIVPYYTIFATLGDGHISQHFIFATLLSLLSQIPSLFDLTTKINQTTYKFLYLICISLMLVIMAHQLVKTCKVQCLVLKDSL